MIRPDTGSPARKRQRLSLPISQHEIGDISEANMLSEDEHNVNFPRTPGFKSASYLARTIVDTPEVAGIRVAFHDSSTKGLENDPDNPFVSASTSLARVSKSFDLQTAASLFTTASKLPLTRDEEYRSPSPEAPPDRNWDEWFQPPEAELDSPFQTAKFTAVSVAFTIPSVGFATANAGFETPSVGFTTASAKKILAPSKEALEKAKARIQQWEADQDEGTSKENQFKLGPSASSSSFQSASMVAKVIRPSFERPALSSVNNATPKTASLTPLGFSRPSLVTGSTISTPSPISRHHPKPFKTPLPKHLVPASPNFTAPKDSKLTHSHPLSKSMTSSTSPAALSTPIRPTRPRGFKTPFKNGIPPPSLPTRQTQSPLVNRKPQSSLRPQPEKPKNANLVVAGHQEFFRLNSTSLRASLSDSGLVPQCYTFDDMERMGITYVESLQRITPETALYYSFNSTSPISAADASNHGKTFGPAEALQDLLARGCTLATKPWVDNHWSLILWKLAGMVALDPESETDPEKKRWCWGEVIRQLLYRYERELNQGCRPPLRKISTQDAPAALPMVLCVSNIIWSAASIAEDGTRMPPHPELEVTDGWYRLRAQIDIAMAKGVRKGTIRVGRKIGVAGATLSAEKKDPVEILEAYNSNKLVLHGNSSQLMPWHTKLGFMHGPCISTLHSLSPFGGLVAVMDIVVVKMYPIAFIEFYTDDTGRRQSEPRIQAEEDQIQAQWMRRREAQASKLRNEIEKKIERYRSYIERLEQKAGHSARLAETDCPENIDDLFDELEYPESAAKCLATITSVEAYWLAAHIRKEFDSMTERMYEDMNRELDTMSSPRSVRSFRVLLVQDARTMRRPGHRVAKLTVWDVLNLSVREGRKAGEFREGERYLVTNLKPSQQRSWMDCGPGSEVYLTTQAKTRWTFMKPAPTEAP